MSIKSRLQSITVLDRIYTKWKWRQRRVSWGNGYPDKTFFVVRRAYCKVGLFSHVMTNMGLVDYAIKQGYIPVIDMQNGKNTYLEDEKVGKENAWEYYFEQPCGYTLEDIRDARNIILSDGLITEKNNYPDFRITEDEELLAYWKGVFRKYFRVSEEILQEFSQRRKAIGENTKLLGILARGTDYVSSRPKGHPIQPTPEQIIEKAGEILRKYGCGKIYLATEDAGIYDKLKEAFGELVVAPDVQRYTTAGSQNINDLGKEQGKYAKGREYLISMLLLADCDCLAAGNVGGTHGVLLMNKGYQYRYIFDLGRYQ